MSGKVLIIGLDGADWTVLHRYLDDGSMPNLAQIIDEGISGPLGSTIPTNSGVAWSTFMTGRNPGKHAVFDFTQRAPHNPTLRVSVNSRSRRSGTFFDALGKHGRQVGVINVPVTYPPFPLNGFMLGGMIVQEGEPFTYPESLAAELEEKAGGFPVNRIRWRFMLGQLEELLEEAIAVTKQRARVLEYLIANKNWDVLIQVFVTLDRLQHPLMHILDPGHPCHDDALAQRLGPRLRIVFKMLDDVLGRSRAQIGDDATLMVVSDHGFRSVHKAVYVGEILSRVGLLKKTKNRVSAARLARRLLRPLPRTAKRALAKASPLNLQRVGSAHEMANVDWLETRAYITTLTSQGVHMNLAGREPHGTVRPGVEYERLLDDIQELLLSERDPDNGRPIIQDVMRGRELYSGPWVDLAPDLLLLPAPGYAFAKGAEGHLQSYKWFMGDHAQIGIFAATGPGVRPGGRLENAALVDIAPTVLYLAGLPIPEDMDGKVLDLFADQRLATAPPAYEEDSTVYKDSEHVYTVEEERLVEEHLRSLGYL